MTGCECHPPFGAAHDHARATPRLRTADFETVREIYDVVENHRFDDFLPPDHRRVADRIDLHVHVGPGRQDPVALGRHASGAGVRALVLKSPFLGSTTEVARVVNRVLREWAEPQELEATELVGSFVLNREGGLRPDIVTKWIGLGARVIWFPVLDSVNHLHRAKGLSADEARAGGLSVLDGDRLRPEAVEILRLVAEAGVAVSFGHLAREEMLALAEASAELGVDRAFVDHPLSPVADLSLDEMVQLSRCGVTCNFTYWELSPYCGISARDMVAAIRHIGIDRTTISSDSSMEIFPDAVECLRLHAAMLDLYGFTEAETAQLMSGNQRRILGL